MEMIHGDFKIGELSPRSGTYTCTSCQRAGRTTTIEMQKGGTFPFCDACREKGTEEIDVVWKVLP
jgi:hypothetical protein